MTSLIEVFQRLWNEYSTAINRLVKRILLAVVVFYLGFVVVEMLFLRWLFSRVYQALYHTGGFTDMWILEGLAWILTLTLHLLVPLIIWNWLSFRRRTATLLVVVLVIVWTMTGHYLSRPRKDQLFNPITKKPEHAYYKDKDGTIQLFPRIWTTHPTVGEPLQELTPKIAREYLEQGGLPFPTRKMESRIDPVWRVNFYKSPRWKEGAMQTNMWVEEVRLNNIFTFVKLSCKGKTGTYHIGRIPVTYDGSGILLPDQKIWLLDTDLAVYWPVADFADYPRKGDGTLAPRLIGREEIYKFWLMFPPLPQGVRRFALYHQQFGKIDVKLYAAE